MTDLIGLNYLLFKTTTQHRAACHFFEEPVCVRDQSVEWVCMLSPCEEATPVCCASLQVGKLGQNWSTAPENKLGAHTRSVPESTPSHGW